MRLSIIVWGLAFLAISCNGLEPQTVHARFIGTCPQTAVKGVLDDDSKVERLDLLVFRASDGKLETVASGDGSAPLEVTVTRSREMRWYMIANSPEGRLDHSLNESDFLSNTILLEDAFVMHAHGKTTFSENGSIVTAPLTRYICKVGIGSITINWADALPARIEAICLMNVQGSAPVSGVASDLALRYNCGIIDIDLGACLTNMLSERPEIMIETSSPVQLGTTLWCMPNPSEGNSFGLPWQSRRTRVAICVNAQGQDNWYPIDLPAMEGNRYYLVDDIVIKGPGAGAPDVKPERVNTTFSIRILDWEEEITPAQF